MENKNLGNKGEEVAAQYLISKGYQILDRNYKISIGEIDIIADFKGILCIIEVKTGTNESTKYFLPEQRVDKNKQNRLRKLAELYVKQNKIDPEKNLRIDTISVIFNEKSNSFHVEQFENI